MMKDKLRDPVYLATVVALVAAPGTIARTYYEITKDPTFQPLGITREDAEKFDQPLAELEVVVLVDWGANTPTNMDKTDLGKRLGKILNNYDVDHRILWRDTSGHTIQLTLKIQHLEFGPFAIPDLATSIPTAIAAYRELS